MALQVTGIRGFICKMKTHTTKTASKTSLKSPRRDPRGSGSVSRVSMVGWLTVQKRLVVADTDAHILLMDIILHHQG